MFNYKFNIITCQCIPLPNYTCGFRLGNAGYINGSSNYKFIDLNRIPSIVETVQSRLRYNEHATVKWGNTNSTMKFYEESTSKATTWKAKMKMGGYHQDKSYSNRYSGWNVAGIGPESCPVYRFVIIDVKP
jgi:hypothetical protein